jgi:hypothetical protein
MFYLNHFFKSLTSFKLSGFLFVLLTVMLTTAIHNRTYVKKIFSLANKTITRPYFNALVTNDVNLNTVARKLKKLPGVEAVRIKKVNDLKDELGSLKGELDTEVLNSLININYTSLTVELGRSLQVRSQSLIREYLTRLVGKDSITISDIKKPKTLKMKKNDPYLLLNNWGDVYIIGLLVIIWFAACFSFSKYLNNYSYLIEKFQRKKKVSLKIFSIGLASVVTLSLLGNLYFNPSIGIGEWLFMSALFGASVLIFKQKMEYKKLI